MTASHDFYITLTDVEPRGRGGGNGMGKGGNCGRCTGGLGLGRNRENLNGLGRTYLTGKEVSRAILYV